jgi:hypothetical protein
MIPDVAVIVASGIVPPGEAAGISFFGADFFAIVSELVVAVLSKAVEKRPKIAIFVAGLSQGFFATQAFSHRFQLLRKIEICWL